MELKLSIKKPEFSFEKIKQVDYRGFIRYYSCHSPIDYHLQVGTRIAMMNALDAIYTDDYFFDGVGPYGVICAIKPIEFNKLKERLLKILDIDYLDLVRNQIKLYSPDMRPDGISEKKGRIVSVHDVVPDILFELIVPKEKLLARFDDSDPKNAWRRWLVEERYDWYLNSTDYIPVEYRDRVVKIDADRPPQEILRDIIYNINSKFNLNINSNG